MTEFEQKVSDRMLWITLILFLLIINLIMSLGQISSTIRSSQSSLAAISGAINDRSRCVR